jgi:hypothetical protein
MTNSERRKWCLGPTENKGLSLNANWVPCKLPEDLLFSRGGDFNFLEKGHFKGYQLLTRDQLSGKMKYQTIDLERDLHGSEIFPPKRSQKIRFGIRG